MMEHSSEIGTVTHGNTLSGDCAIRPRMRHFKEKSWSKTGNRDRRLTPYSSPIFPAPSGELHRGKNSVTIGQNLAANNPD